MEKGRPGKHAPLADITNAVTEAGNMGGGSSSAQSTLTSSVDLPIKRKAVGLSGSRFAQAPVSDSPDYKIEMHRARIIPAPSVTERYLSNQRRGKSVSSDVQ